MWSHRFARRLRVEPGRRLVEEHQPGRCTRPSAMSSRRRWPPDSVLTARSRGRRGRAARSSSAPRRGASASARRTAGPGRRAPRRRGAARVGARRPARRSRSGGARRPGRAARSQPATVAVAARSAPSSVVSIRSVVVLPAPLGPRKPTISPASTSRSTPRTASTGPVRVRNVRASARAWITRASARCRSVPAILACRELRRATAFPAGQPHQNDGGDQDVQHDQRGSLEPGRLAVVDDETVTITAMTSDATSSGRAPG